MPFIRKTETKQFPVVTDARNLFIGRSDEIQFFVDHILRPEEPSHNIISLYGQGGVGKTTLLGRFIEEAHAISVKNSCLTARVDEQQASLTSMMERFAEQLGIKGEFDKAAAQYRESLRKLQAERELAHDTIGRKATTAITKSLSKGVPIVGDALEQGTSFAVDFMWDEIQYRQRLKDEKHLENPIRDLTKAFVKELNERAKSHHRLILCFDTFERLAQDVAPWLLDYFLPADLNGNIVLVVAGRDPIERSLSDDPKRWLSYIDQNVIHQIELKSFTEEETSKYLMERGISDDDKIAQIWQLSHGLPLYLGLLTANPQGQIDPTADVVRNFLRWIPKQEQAKKKVVLDIALLSRPFNRDELKAFSYISNEERPELYNWLLMQPFVRRNIEDGRCSYHEVVQDSFRRHLYTDSPDDCHATRRALVEYYRGVLTCMEQAEGKEVYKSPQWLELRLALAYQLLLLTDEVSYIKAIEEVFYVLVYRKRREIASFLREIRQEQLKMKISSGARRTAEALLQCVEFDVSKSELQTAIDLLLKKARSTPTFSKEMLAAIYNHKGRIYYSLKDYQHAIDDYSQALSLDPPQTDYYNNRGIAYAQLKDYQHAIDDYSQALSLDPNFASAYYRRGNAYARLKDYQHAIDDYSQALSLNPNHVYAYNNRGNAYARLKDYQHAIDDYSQALSLNPNHVYAYNNRGNAYALLKNYQHAIDDYSQALSLDPNHVYAYNNRGHAYHDLKDYQHAIDDYCQALYLNPNYAYACNNRGCTYRATKQYEQAITDHDRAIELDPAYAWAHFSRGFTYLWLKDCQQATFDFLRSWELDPDDLNKGWMTEWSLMCLEMANEEIVEHLDAIAEHLDAIAASKPGDSVAFDCRGTAHWIRKQFYEALAELEQAIPLEPEEGDAYFWQGMVYASLGRDEEAKSTIEMAISKDLPPVLLSPLRWLEQDRPEFYVEYVAPLLARFNM